MGQNGGLRPNAGRPNAGTSRITVMLSPEDHDMLRALGGSDYLQRHLRRVAAGEETALIRPATLKGDLKEAFIRGAVSAGGSPDAWPFVGKRKETLLPVTGSDVSLWGVDYFRGSLPPTKKKAPAASPVPSSAPVRSPAAALWSLAPYAETTVSFKR